MIKLSHRPLAAEQSVVFFVVGRIVERAEHVFDAWGDEQSGENAGQERVGPQPIAAVVLVVAFADRVETGDVGLVIPRRAGHQATFRGPLVVGPHAAHRVVDGRKNLHRRLARIDALEFFVDVQDAAQLAVEFFARNVR